MAKDGDKDQDMSEPEYDVDDEGEGESDVEWPDNKCGACEQEFGTQDEDSVFPVLNCQESGQWHDMAL